MAARSSSGRKVRPFHRGENTPFVSSNASRPLPSLLSSPVFPRLFRPLSSDGREHHAPSSPPPFQSQTSSVFPGIIMKGSSKRKSIDDGARSSSFNPHRAHERNPLVYQAEIKSLAAVAKSIIP